MGTQSTAGVQRRSREVPANEIAEDLARDGCVMIQDVLSPEWVRALQAAYNEAVDEKAASKLGLADERHPPGWFEIARVLERSEIFENLMDVPKVLAVAGRVLGPDLDLASGGELDFKAPGRLTNYCGWHTDFTWIVSLPYPRQVFWIGCYFLIDDVTEDVGPLTVLPGSHRAPGPPPTDYNAPAGDCGSREGPPRAIEGAVDALGRAGDCLMINTEIWHMSRANGSNRARKLIKVHYKPPWMKVWGGGREYTDAFAERQTDPIRRQLVGLMPYDEVPWTFAPSAPEMAKRYPMARLLQSE